MVKTHHNCQDCKEVITTLCKKYVKTYIDEPFCIRKPSCRDSMVTYLIGDSLPNYKSSKQFLVLDDLQGIEESHQDIKTNESSDLREDGMLEWTIECTPTIINVKKEPLIVGENETSQTQHSKIDVPPVTANSGMSRKLIKNGLDIPVTKKPRVALPRISEDERSVSSRPSTPLNRSLSRSSKKKSVNTKDKTKSKLSLI